VSPRNRVNSSTGTFEAGANSLGGKWFATTMDDAAQWGAKFYPKETFQIVQARVSQEAANAMMHLKKLDNIGPAVYAELEQLVGAAIRFVK
jgi:hypothetical protein